MPIIESDRKPKLVLILLFLALSASAGASFQISSSTTDGGGGVSSGAQFVLTGTIGQPEASRTTFYGGQFLLSSGFWGAGQPMFGDDLIFEDGFE